MMRRSPSVLGCSMFPPPTFTSSSHDRMLDWERRALELESGDEPRFIRTVGVTFDPDGDTTGTAWWVTAFFAPEIWRRWGVGILHGSLNLWLAEGVVDFPGVTLALPETIQGELKSSHPVLMRRWQHVAVTPAIVQGEALGFVIRGAEFPSKLVE